MGKIEKKGASAVEKKAKVKKVIEKPKPAKKSPAKKVIKAEKTGISGKFTGLKQKTPRKKPAAKDDKIIVKIDGEKAATAPKKQKKTLPKNTKGVVKINSLPHGFYEDQLQGYFTQFGEVTNVKVMRSLKTGRSKGVAFVEFAIAEVAEIAAETMNNYLLFKSLLKTEYLPPGKVKPGLFKNQVQIIVGPDGKKKIKSKLIDQRDKEVKTLNKTPTKDQAAKRQAKFADKLKKQNKFIKKLGVDLDVTNLVQGKLGGKPKTATVKATKNVEKVSAAEVEESLVVPEKKQKVEQKKPKQEAKKKQPVNNKANGPEKKDTAKPEAKKKAEKIPVAAPVEEKPVTAPKKEKAVKAKPVKVIKDVPAPVAASNKPANKKAEKKAGKKPTKKAIAKDDSPKKKSAAKPKKVPVSKPTTTPKAPNAATKTKGAKEKKALVTKSIEKKKPLKLNTKKSVK